ncbi:O-methyltransferase family 3 [Desulfurobacterium thermolithotrophum DSM 11699]|uniref:tRNA 5-hydroxyuridine methyltransferase n=1 Tax=Desulfurobacterium thermolithotrophum (strain DSM 11699 / BSA) TaxID=868864 RepID=F0S259_DESTD|nr:O-methyltransferase [Desulfurobacterium thermolithotrophum]ADY73002.1 O-methyltransferase family 3 [Desulfurobacterium thermolithotrophum DSM 11699]
MTFKRWKNLSEIIPEEIEIFTGSFGKKESILLEMEIFAKKNKIPILLPSAAIVLRLLVSLTKPKRVLEIGTGIGYSTLNIYFAHPEAKITTVDSNRKRSVVAKKFFKRAGIEIEVLEADGFKVIRDYLAENEKFDFIFIDSVKSEYPFFNFKFQALLKSKGIAVFDNVLFRGYIAGKTFHPRYTRTVALLKKFLLDVRKYPGFETYLVPVGDGLLISVKR